MDEVNRISLHFEVRHLHISKYFISSNRASHHSISEVTRDCGRDRFSKISNGVSWSLSISQVRVRQKIIMAVLPVTSIFSLLLLAHRILALQVSPDSPCASVCIDGSGLNGSDPNSSNTYGSDIVCLDDSFHTTTVGQKYESCVSCLQNSTAVASGESDTEWFLCKSFEGFIALYFADLRIIRQSKIHSELMPF